MDFDLEFSDKCKHDRMMIYDGSKIVDDKLMVKHCGNFMPNQTQYKSTSNQLLVVFVSDTSIETKGFKFNYTVVTYLTFLYISYDNSHNMI